MTKASLSAPGDTFKGFIDKIYQELPEKLAKLAMNSMIGCFNLKDKEIWELAVKPSTNYNNMFYHFLNQDGTHIFSRQIGKDTYYQGFKKTKHIREETESPLYNMILEMEAIELHKLATIIQSKGGQVLDLSTDSVSCVFPMMCCLSQPLK